MSKQTIHDVKIDLYTLKEERKHVINKIDELEMEVCAMDAEIDHLEKKIAELQGEIKEL